ncbi:MAG: zinc-ribbon domain-containing protein, partial [Polyangiaceae bacterium]
MKFLCEQCKAKYQIADEKAAGKTVRMKCRKCGYLIEVRATVTEAGGEARQAPGGRTSRPPPPAGNRPLPPRAAPLATSLASARSPAKPERSGALAGALKTAIQRERDEEVSAPVDMSDLSPSDEWY